MQESDSPPSSPVNDPGDLTNANGADARLRGEADGAAAAAVPPTCSFVSSPPSNAALIDEIKFFKLKGGENQTEVYTSCPTFNDYLATIQDSEIRPRHRHIVFEWILKIGDKNMLQLNNKALQYAFRYFDRYLSIMKVSVKQLQLVATACAWVASKVCSDEVPVGLASQLCRLVGGIEQEELLQMEKWLLAALGWKLHPVTPLDFVRVLMPYVELPVGCEPAEPRRVLLEQYVENISLAQALVYPLLKYPQAILAVAAVVCGAHLISGRSGVGTGGGKGKPPASIQDHEPLNVKLSKIAGVNVRQTRACQSEMLKFINLKSLADHMQPPADKEAAKYVPKRSDAELASERLQRLRQKTAGHTAAKPGGSQAGGATDSMAASPTG